MTNSLPNALRWAVSANFLVSSLNLVGLFVFARLLGKEIIGEYGVLLVGIEVTALVFSFGFNQAVIRYKDDQSVFSAAFTLITLQSLAVAIVVVLIGWTSTAFSLRFFELDYPLALLLTARILTFYTTLAYAPFESHLNYQPIATSKVIGAIAGLGVGILIALSYSANELVLPLRDLTTAGTMFFLLAPRAPFKYRWVIHKATILKVWHFTRPIWYLNLLERLALRTDYVLAAYSLNQASFGVYFQVRALMEGVLGFVVSPIQTVVYSYYCNVDNVLSVFKRLVRKWLFPVLLVVFMLIVVFGATDLGASIVGFVYGADWRSGGALLAGFSVYMIAMLVFEHSKVIGIAAHVKRPAIAGRIVQILFIAIAVVLFIRWLELFGAGLASGIGGTLLCLVTTILLYRSKTAEKVSPSG